MHILTAPSTDSSVVSGTGSIVTFPGIVHDDDDASAPASAPASAFAASTIAAFRNRICSSFGVSNKNHGLCGASRFASIAAFASRLPLNCLSCAARLAVLKSLSARLRTSSRTRVVILSCNFFANTAL